MQAQALDRFAVGYGICNPLYGVQMVFSEDMADALPRAELYGWRRTGSTGTAAARLDRDPDPDREVGRRDRTLREECRASFRY